MMGYTHVTCGLVTGIVTLPLAPVHHWSTQVAWVVTLGGASLLPDLDAPSSTAARMWGPPTRLLARAIGIAARGHRQGTHDILLAPMVVGGTVFLAALHPVALGVVLALMIGLSLRGLALAGVGRVGTVLNLTVSTAGAWWLVTHGAAGLGVLPVVVAAGVVVHVLGDLVTTGGVPVPFTWLTTHPRRVFLNLFRVGGTLERAVVAPALSLAGILLLGTQLGIHDISSLVAWSGSLVDHLAGTT